ncbi:TetR family transcriptional regulator [Hyphomonas polymorpha PS728]|uniref:TetR family transcriptional regulator n=1 Tax=Hyphomonas polymorpha PS728 TaxID=1280954 RepID=A0A062V8K2_9PROT|nr:MULTISPECIES: TetR/AcrR family transcriptional regulator [Hyphomonas]AXE65824.1 TetR family transcriptional regulator [Hyphomonas sp. CACIAM 19H1]KCZ98501.1 TetR family transcriptional regulator [Hyphomonas polymorpha PS728]
MTQMDDTRKMILHAAVERILHYGYSKTTMAEIAKDCNMSAGNIYRFFASKLDIAEAMARKFNEEAYATFAKIADKKVSAADRMREIFHYELTRTYSAIAEEAKILEVAEVLSDERPLYMNEKLAKERTYLVQIMKDGVAAGEFRSIDNPEEVAEMWQAALMKFRFPQLFSKLTLPKLQREIDGVMDLLLAGLSPGATPPAAWESLPEAVDPHCVPGVDAVMKKHLNADE